MTDETYYEDLSSNEKQIYHQIIHEYKSNSLIFQLLSYKHLTDFMCSNIEEIKSIVKKINHEEQ